MKMYILQYSKRGNRGRGRKSKKHANLLHSFAWPKGRFFPETYRERKKGVEKI